MDAAPAAEPLHPVRKLAWAYAALFCAVVATGYVPGFTDEAGLLFGLFELDLYDDGLHLASGLWAGAAAALSVRASVLYFRIFGVLYGLDGVVGLFAGSAYLDFGLLVHGPLDLPFATRFFANLPHILIGGTAAAIGFGLCGRGSAR